MIRVCSIAWRLAALALSLPLAATEARAQLEEETQFHVVVLATAATPARPPALTLPGALRGRSLYWRRQQAGNSVQYQYCLGFFATRAEAEGARGHLGAEFRAARVIAVGAGERERALDSAGAAAPAPVPTPAPQGKAGAGSAEALMVEGRAAIAREDYAAAIGAFTQLLALPENPLSRDALEFMALSRERSGDTTRARIEYENYLRRYPEGEDAVRVRQRLANLRPPAPAEVLHAPARGRDGSRTMVYGSLSQFYYRGNSKIDLLQASVVTPNTLDRTTLTLTDQSALLTNLDLSARFIGERTDSRLVLRDSNTQNFIAGQSDVNRLNAAYYEYKYKPADALVRLGRQPGYGGGLLGRFDGATLGYGLTPGIRLNVVGGEPVNLGAAIESHQRFYGVNTDLGPFDQHWSGNLFMVRQTVDGIADRDATGVELRYFAPRGSVFTIIEYDRLFHELSAATLQGNYVSASKSTFNLMVDYRLTPSLQTTSAIIGEATTSIGTLLNTYTEDQLRLRARSLTASLKMVSAAATTPITPAWQLGANYSASRLSGTDGTNNVPATPDSGPVHTFTGQAIGTGLYAKRDVTVFAASRVSAASYAGSALRWNSHAPFGERWMLDSSVMLYRQSNVDGTTLRRVSPTLRFGYQWRSRVAFEVELGVENTDNRSAISQEKTRRNYYSLGYRWDF